MNAPLPVFAYGSNMSTVRLRARTRSARFLARGQLEKHSLRWHKRSVDGSGKCNALATGRRSDLVWGVLFELDRRGKDALDAAEGLGRGYEEQVVRILTGDGVRLALAYIAQDVDETLTPYHWYKNHVLTGAREHGLPDDYIAGIVRVRSIEDLDVRRAAMNHRLHWMTGTPEQP